MDRPTTVTGSRGFPEPLSRTRDKWMLRFIFLCFTGNQRDLSHWRAQPLIQCAQLAEKQQTGVRLVPTVWETLQRLGLQMLTDTACQPTVSLVCQELKHILPLINRGCHHRKNLRYRYPRTTADYQAELLISWILKWTILMCELVNHIKSDKNILTMNVYNATCFPITKKQHKKLWQKNS